MLYFINFHKFEEKREKLLTRLKFGAIIRVQQHMDG